RRGGAEAGARCAVGRRRERRWIHHRRHRRDRGHDPGGRVTRDSYPELDTLPADWLVPPADQPEYLDLPGFDLDENVNLGAALSDAVAARGHADLPAIISESGV